jgi:hypothetical protein
MLADKQRLNQPGQSWNTVEYSSFEFDCYTNQT